jgi:hypothetical protein
MNYRKRQNSPKVMLAQIQTGWVVLATRPKGFLLIWATITVAAVVAAA